MKIALVIADCGDGSATIRFFKDVDFAEKIAYHDYFCEELAMSEGGTIIEVPDDFKPPAGWSDQDYREEVERAGLDLDDE
jgi:hypothetical protein